MTPLTDDTHTPLLGVIIVTFNASDVILDCLESLLAARDVRLAIVVVDNASPDRTPDTITHWAAGRHADAASAELPFEIAPCPKPIPLGTQEEVPFAATGHRLTLIETGLNVGFAAGVNRGLDHLSAHQDIDRFWILNPDSIVPPGTPPALARAAGSGPGGAFSLMGGRIVYCAPPYTTIQLDGGTIDRRTGSTRNVNQFGPSEDTPPPDPGRLDFIAGTHMVVSRAFLESAGLMPEDYFLYYEEVDWALCRADLPLAFCDQAPIYHRAGTAIGSGRPDRSPTPFSVYFLHRNRMKLMRRYFPRGLAGAYVFSIAKAGQFALRGEFPQAHALLAGAFGRPPSKRLRGQLSPEAATIAFDTP